VAARPSQIIFKCTHERPVAAPELADWEATFKASGHLLSFMSCRIKYICASFMGALVQGY